VSQQQFSYFDPEQETVYEPRCINRDPRELQEDWHVQEQTVYYVTPEQSMLRGEKLIPTQRMKPHANWIVAAIFLLVMLFGGFIWAHEVRPIYSGEPGIFQSKPDIHPWDNQKHYPSWGIHKHHPGENNEFHPGENEDNWHP
jgi:hypothetical protein